MVFSLDDFDATFLAMLEGKALVKERTVKKVNHKKSVRKEELKPREVLETPVAIGLVASVLETVCKCGRSSQRFQKEYIRYAYKAAFENKAITEITKIDAERMRVKGGKFLLKQKIAVDYCEYCTPVALEAYAGAEIIEV